MVFKVIVAVVLIAVANGSGYFPATRVYHEEPLEHRIKELDRHPQYTHNYAVSDVVFGDSKNHNKTHDGDAVQGVYPLVDADGYRRIVKCTADDVNGDREPIHSAVISPVVPKSIAPVTYTAPNTPRFIKQEPITYAAPYIIDSIADSTVIQQAPVDYAVPTFMRSIPASYETRSVFKPRLIYTSDAAISGSLPFGYSAAAPTLVRSLTVYHSAPLGYTLVKSAPDSYGNW